MTRIEKIELLRTLGWSTEQVAHFLKITLIQIDRMLLLSNVGCADATTIEDYLTAGWRSAEVDLYISDVVLAAAVRYVQPAHKLTTLGIPSEVTIADLINEKEEGSWKEQAESDLVLRVDVHPSLPELIYSLDELRDEPLDEHAFSYLKKQYPLVDIRKFATQLELSLWGQGREIIRTSIGRWLIWFDVMCKPTNVTQSFLDVNAEVYVKIAEFLELQVCTENGFNFILPYCHDIAEKRRLERHEFAVEQLRKAEQREHAKLSRVPAAVVKPAETYVKVSVGKNVTALSEEQYVFLATRYSGVESKKFHTLLEEVIGHKVFIEQGKVPTVGDFLLWYHEQQESSCRSFSPTVLEYGRKIMQYLYPPVEVVVNIENTNICRTTKFTKRALEIGREYEPKIKLLLSKDFSVYALHDGKLTYLGIAEPDVECIDNPFYHTPELGILREPKL